MGRALGNFEEEADAASRLWGLALVHHALDDKAASDAALKELDDRFGADGMVRIAEVYAYRGEVEAAFAWLDRAFDQKDSNLGALRVNLYFESLRSDPRYLELLEKLGLADE